MSFAGNQYPNFADKVITTRGDIIRGDSSGDRERYGIGAANTVLTSDGTDPAWAAHGGVPTTTKGDISGFSTTQARIPVGTNNYTILADSAQALGLKYGASSTSTLTTTGDILAASAANTLTRIAGGASGEILTGNGAGVLPTFQAASAGGGAWTKLSNTTGTSLDSGSLTDYDMYMVIGSCLNTTNGGKLQMQINSDGSGNYDYEQGKKGSWSGVAAAGYIEISSSPAGAQMQNIFVGYFTQRQFSQDMHNFFILDNPSVVGAASADYAIRCFGQHDESADITSFQITASTGVLSSSSAMNVYGLNLTA